MWLFELTSFLGSVFVDAPPVEVPRLRSYMYGSFLFIILTLVLVLVGKYLWWSITQAERRRATSPTNEGRGMEGGPED